MQKKVVKWRICPIERSDSLLKSNSVFYQKPRQNKIIIRVQLLIDFNELLFKMLFFFEIKCSITHPVSPDDFKLHFTKGRETIGLI